MRGKSNVMKRNVEKVWGARYLPNNTVLINYYRNDRDIHRSDEKVSCPKRKSRTKDLISLSG
jgi:hypothetical protein